MSGQQSNMDLTLTETDKKEIQKLAAKNPTIDKLYNIYLSYTEDPSKGWKNTIIFAQKEIENAVLKKDIDIIKDGYHKSLWEMLKGGASVAKTIASASAEAKIEEEAPKKPKSDDIEDEDIVPITPETAK